MKHPALKKGFKNLFGYTSDEEGVRHALLERDAADVDVLDALFMYGACASFAAYLVSKHQKTSGTQSSERRVEEAAAAAEGPALRD